MNILFPSLCLHIAKVVFYLEQHVFQGEPGGSRHANFINEQQKTGAASLDHGLPCGDRLRPQIRCLVGTQ